MTVVTLRTGDHPAEETLDGVRVIRIHGWSGGRTAFHADAARPFHPTVPDPGAMAALRRVVQRERPDVVHSHSWLQYSYFPLHHRQRGPAHVVTLHDYGLACPKKTLQHVTRRLASSADGPPSEPTAAHLSSRARARGWRSASPARQSSTVYSRARRSRLGLRASRILHGRADRYIAISTAVADGSRHALPSRSEIVVIPTMVPNDLPALARSTPRPAFLPPEDGYLMFVGALGRHKGVDVLLEARRRMRNRPPLVLIGTPRADTPRIDDPEVVIAHNVPSAQVMASWMRASVAVVPSVMERADWGRWPIEAMLVGRAVVASDVGGLRDVVEHGTTGLMVPPGDPGALAAALDSLLDNPEARRRMGEWDGCARGSSRPAVVPRVIETFREVLH